MNGKALTWALTGTLLACGLAAATAQQRQAAASKPDPRVGLKAGIRDAGQAIRNMTRCASRVRSVLMPKARSSASSVSSDTSSASKASGTFA